MRPRPFDYLRTLPGRLHGALGALIWTGVLYRAVGVIVFAPLTGLLLSGLLARADRTALMDQDIAAFLLEPWGAVVALVMLSLALTLIALEQSCLMTILHGRARGAAVGAVATLRFTLVRAPAIFALAARILLGALLLALPFVAAAGLVYLRLLTEYDINYYLAERPREYALALGLGALIGAGLAGVLLGYAARVILALPILLFEGRAPAVALAESVRRTRGGRREVIALLLAWAVAGLVLAALSALPGLLFGALLIDLFSGDTGVQLLVVGTFLMTLFVSQLVASLLIASAFSLATISLYEPRAAGDAVHGPRPGTATRADSRWSAAAVIVTAGMVAVLALGVGWWVLDRAAVADRSEVTAHRGASGLAPENTLAAVERAIAAGADWVEIDVQRTGDGVVVVVHDRDLRRLGGSGLTVAATPYGELREVDVGSWFDPAYADQRIPTLAEVLRLCRGRIGVNVELKYYGWDAALAPAVIGLIEEAGMADQVVLMSLDPRGVRQAKSLRPHWRVGRLTAVAIGDLTRVEADFLAVHSANAGGRLVRSARAAGKGVQVWTVNDPAGMHAMYSLGVEALITDYPARAVALRNERAGLDGGERLLLGIGLRVLAEPKHLDPAAETAR